jgi:hypothetical protein
MPAHKMKFVVVNNRAPRNASVCAAYARPLERGPDPKGPELRGATPVALVPALKKPSLVCTK